MKPSFRFRLAAVTATSLMVLVAACGSSSSSSSKANTTTTAAASGSTAATPSSAASSTTPTTAPIIGDITFSGVTPNAGNWALQVGVDEGIFRQYGINGKIIYSQSSPASLAALFGGSVQFTTALYDAAIPAWQKNNDLIYVASGYDILPYELVVSPSITSVDQLKGKTCGAQNPPTVGDGLYVQLMISEASKATLNYPKDFQIATVPVTAGPALAALKSGQVACMGELPPVSGLLNNQGYPTLIHAADLTQFRGLPFFGLNTLKSWATSHKDQVVAFLKGYLASIAWLEDPANKDAAIQLLAKNASLAVADATAAYSWVTAGGFPRQGLIKDDALANDLKLAQQFGRLTDVTAAQLQPMVDLSYIKQAYADLPQSVKNEPSAASS
jgi:ABC-type nitrate/sulfonate/bicarbonate transport system substrate-binding protein